MVRNHDRNHQDSSPSYLMNDRFMNTTKFPSVKEVHEKLDDLVPRVKKGYEMYNHVLSFCPSEDIAPQFDNLPFNESMLPGRVSILDHLVVHLNRQNHHQAGGSFKNFLSKTTEFLTENRQISSFILPIVRTIVFNESSKQDVSDFVNELNECVANTAKFDFGYLPTTLLVMHTEYIDVVNDNVAVVNKILKDDIKVTKYQDCKLPSRIVFFSDNVRFDVVIPWSKTDTGYQLKISGNTEDYFHGIFKKIKGVVTGMGVGTDIDNISNFFTDNYKFRNCGGDIVLKHIELGVLLLVCGINSVPYDLSCLLYFFTGGLHHRQTVFEKNLGTKDALSDMEDTYLHSKVHSMYVIFHTALLYLLLTLFPTPGIAWYVSYKPPVKILSWFNQFIVLNLPGASLDNMEDVFAVARDDTPIDILDNLEIPAGHSGVMNIEFLSTLIPQWRGPTGGGPVTDLQVISHLVKKFTPVFSNLGVPHVIRWPANQQECSETLGQLHSEGHKIDSDLYLLPGVNFDSNLHKIRPLSDVIDIKNHKGSVLDALLKIGELSDLSCHDLKQLFVASLWNHPMIMAEVMYAIEVEKRLTFDGDILILSRPLLLSYAGEDDRNFGDSSSFMSEKKDFNSWMRLFVNYLNSKNPMESNAKKRKARKVLKRECKRRCIPFHDVKRAMKDKDVDGYNVIQDTLAAVRSDAKKLDEKEIPLVKNLQSVLEALKENGDDD